MEKSPAPAPPGPGGMGRYGRMPMPGMPGAGGPIALVPGMAPGGQPVNQAASDRAALAARYGVGGGRANREASDRAAVAARYGPSAGVGRPAAPVPQPTYYTPARQPTSTGPETVLDESLLSFTVRLDAIRPLTPVK